MSFFFQPLQAVFHREASESNGSATPGAVACHRFDVGWELPQDGGAGIIAPLSGLNCVDLCSAWAVLEGQDVADPSAIQSQSDDNRWLVLPADGVLDNGIPALQDRTLVVAPGFTTLQLKTPALRLAGAALATFVTAPTAVDGYVNYTSQGGAGRVSNATFGSFVDSAVDTPPNIPGLLSVTERQFIQGGARYFLGQTSGGTNLFVNDCGVAYNDPCGCLFITAADIGNSNEQIPTDALSNSPAHYKFHPSVFFRRAQAVRGILSLDPTEPVPVTEDLGNLQLFEVSRAPTHSRWIFIVDGAEMDVIVAHPVGSDIRRPRDIWNQIIVASLLQNNAGGSALVTFQVDGSTGSNVYSARDLIKRLQYLQYARFIEPLDDDITPILVPIPQTVPSQQPPP